MPTKFSRSLATFAVTVAALLATAVTPVRADIIPDYDLWVPITTLRENIDDAPFHQQQIGQNWPDDGDNFRRARPALFGYSYGLANESNSFDARLALSRAFTLQESDSGDRGLYIMPSFSLDRRNDGTFDRELMVGRLGVESKQIGSDGYGILSRVSAGYATGLDFGAETFVGEFEIEPVLPFIANLESRPVPGLGDAVNYRLRAIIHFETLYFIDPEVDAHKLGGRIQLDLLPNGDILNRLGLHVSYLQYEKLTDDSTSREAFEASADVRLDSQGHFNATLAYRDGDGTLNGDTSNDIVAGLGLRF